jgi:hypothetical protein
MVKADDRTGGWPFNTFGPPPLKTTMSGLPSRVCHSPL